MGRLITDCSYPCDYNVRVNNYNFTVRYSVTEGDRTIPPDHSINVTSMAIDAIHKALIVNISAIEPATLTLFAPKSLIDAPLGSGKFAAYADGRDAKDYACTTLSQRRPVCVLDDAATSETDSNFNATTTMFMILVDETGKHSISIIGTQVAPEFPFSNTILPVTIVGFVGTMIVLIRFKPRDLKQNHAE